MHHPVGIALSRPEAENSVGSQTDWHNSSPAEVGTEEVLRDGNHTFWVQQRVSADFCRWQAQTWYVETTIRLTLAALWRGVTAINAMIVEQLGLAMMPPLPYRKPAIAWGLISGMTSGTPSVIRKAELLSTTCDVTTVSRYVYKLEGIHVARMAM